MKLELTTAPALEPIATNVIQSWLDIPEDTDSALVDLLQSSARKNAERYTERAFINQTWAMMLDLFPTANDHNVNGAIFLPKGKIQSITTFKYINSSGTLTTLVADTDYFLDNTGDVARLLPATSWPTPHSTKPNGVQIVYVAGHGTSLDSEFNNARLAMLMDVADLYENRQRLNDAQLYESPSYKDLLKGYKIYFDFSINDK